MIFISMGTRISGNALLLDPKRGKIFGIFVFCLKKTERVFVVIIVRGRGDIVCGVGAGG